MSVVEFAVALWAVVNVGLLAVLFVVSALQRLADKRAEADDKTAQRDLPLAR